MNLLFVMLVLANFLKTVGLIVVIYFVLKLLGRLLFPVVVKKAVNNMQARQSQYQRQSQQKQEGEVTVEKNRNRQNRANNTEGEYVDFEEIE
jgi:membrane protein implicated in regulation of membrane protease activity